MARTTITFVINDDDMCRDGVEVGGSYDWGLDGETIEVVPTKIHSVTFDRQTGKWRIKADLRMTRQHQRILDAHSVPEAQAA